MAEVVTIGDATLYHGDCLEILPTLPKVDAVVTDPPYGISYVRNSKKTAALGKIWGDGFKKELAGKDENPIHGDGKPFDPSCLLSVGRRHVLWGASAYSNMLPANYGWMIWDKQIVGEWSGGDCETAWTNFLGSNRIHRQRWQGMIREGDECPYVGGGLVHPTQKPVRLMAWCVEKTKTEGPVLDPYMGSGSTGVACARLGRGFIGIEIERRYFDIACERIAAAYSQGRLFA